MNGFVSHDKNIAVKNKLRIWHSLRMQGEYFGIYLMIPAKATNSFKMKYILSNACEGRNMTNA